MGKYEDWLTKEQAAQRLGVSERTVMRLADDRKVQQAMRPRAGGSPLAVFNPEDVERVASERAAAASIPFVMPPDTTAQVPAVRGQVTPEKLMKLFQASPAGKTLSLDKKLWLTFDEAVAYSGLGKSRLQQLVAAGQVRTDRGPHRSIVLSRVDLESHG